jgi:osmotically-inducible protein OsmY
MRVTIKVNGGCVSFDGAGYSAGERAALREVAAAVPGVRETEDLMRTISMRARFA